MSESKSTSSDIIRSFQVLQKQVFDECSFQVADLIVDHESKEYDACSFKLNDLDIIYRSSKITPTKVGQFVTLWKRNKDGIIRPMELSDQFDLVVINSQRDDDLGQFVFPRSVLMDKGIVTTELKEGKRGFRVYPPWDLTTSSQAKHTQSWQLDYFHEYHDPNLLDIRRVKMLYSKSKKDPITV